MSKLKKLEIIMGHFKWETLLPKSIITAQVDFAGLRLYNYGITKGG